MVLLQWKSCVCSIKIACARIIQWSFCPRRLHSLLHSSPVLHLGFYHVFSYLPIFNVVIFPCCIEFGWLRSSFFIASFPNTSGRLHPRVPSGLCSLSFSSSFSIWQRELTPYLLLAQRYFVIVVLPDRAYVADLLVGRAALRLFLSHYHTFSIYGHESYVGIVFFLI